MTLRPIGHGDGYGDGYGYGDGSGYGTITLRRPRL